MRSNALRRYIPRAPDDREPPPPRRPPARRRAARCGRAVAWLADDAPFGLLAHDTPADSRFIYANLAALACFEYPDERADRPPLAPHRRGAQPRVAPTPARRRRARRGRGRPTRPAHRQVRPPLLDRGRHSLDAARRGGTPARAGGSVSQVAGRVRVADALVAPRPFSLQPAHLHID